MVGKVGRSSRIGQPIRERSLVDALKAAGVYQKLDMLQVYAQGAENVALIDLVNPSRVATAVSGPTFTANLGYTGNGSTSYIETNYNPSTGVNFTANTHSFGLVQTGTAASDSSIFGWFDGTDGITLCTRRSTDGNTNTRAVATSAQLATDTFGGDASGFYIINRTSSSSVTMYKNGVKGTPKSSTATTLNNATLNVFRISGSSYLGGRGVGLVFAGAMLTDAEASAFYAAVRDFFAQKGVTL